ncbi:hypothetical protein RHGRI_015363 [Rhododendron griersonianum]|uniref:Uncharacterized protein n=1 Tax=Rhododendron griersonianum TaxID=479676 RepID=A0AAV6HZE6_9ERIC|nr:hypothetical protein RHGRI_033895 [Rhododendron griersonianum]KAG5550378.1 hypothetical protein RHGRI_015363 [Rhododendron griersonianum]
MEPPASESLISDNRLTISRFPAPKSAGIALGGCRTGMAKVTNAYDLPASFEIQLCSFLFGILPLAFGFGCSLLGGKTSGFIYCGPSVAGVFNLSYACRSGAKEGIKELKVLGVRTVSQQQYSYKISSFSIPDSLSIIGNQWEIAATMGVLVFLAAKSGFIKDAEDAAVFQNFIICVENGRKEMELLFGSLPRWN